VGAGVPVARGPAPLVGDLRDSVVGREAPDCVSGVELDVEVACAAGADREAGVLGPPLPALVAGPAQATQDAPITSDRTNAGRPDMEHPPGGRGGITSARGHPCPGSGIHEEARLERVSTTVTGTPVVGEMRHRPAGERVEGGRLRVGSDLGRVISTAGDPSVDNSVGC
jgi:hypothetical protein